MPPKTKPIRWRLQWWISGDESHSRSQWYSHACKLCAAHYAQSLSFANCDINKVNRGNARWSVSRVKGHLGEPVIVATSASIGEVLLRRHGH